MSFFCDEITLYENSYGVFSCNKRFNTRLFHMKPRHTFSSCVVLIEF